MTISDDYFADTGETVGKAAIRLHALGISIEQAAHQIGYATSSDLRKWLARRGLECPWPPSRAFPHRGRPQIKITDKVLDDYCALRLGGAMSSEACSILGHSERSIYSALKNRRPGVRLPRVTSRRRNARATQEARA